MKVRMVVLCCMDLGLQYELGNLLESSYDEVTNGVGMRIVRDAMNTKDMWCVGMAVWRERGSDK